MCLHVCVIYLPSLTLQFYFKTHVHATKHRHVHTHTHTERTESVILVTMTRCIHTLRGRVGAGEGWRGDERGCRNVAAKCHNRC